MIKVPLMRSELEVLIEAIEVACLTGWPSKDKDFKIGFVKQQLERKLAELKSQGWQGGR